MLIAPHKGKRHIQYKAIDFHLQFFSVNFPCWHFTIVGVVMCLRRFDCHRWLMKGWLVWCYDTTGRRFTTGFAVMLQFIAATVSVNFYLIEWRWIVQHCTTFSAVSRRPWCLLVYDNRVFVAGASHEFQSFALCLMKCQHQQTCRLRLRGKQIFLFS